MPNEAGAVSPFEDEHGKCFLAVGPNCWGKGKTREAAVQQARKCKPSWYHGTVKWIIFYCDPRCYISDMGDICWKEEWGKPERIAG